MIPKLYRYRKDDIYAEEAIIYGKVVESITSEFNDPYELVPAVDLNEIIKYSTHRNNINGLIDFLKWIDVQFNLSWWMHKTIDIESLYRENNIAELQRIFKFALTTNEIYRTREFTQYIYPKLKSILEELWISCFSEENDSHVMWSQYAESGTGLCLSYDLNLSENELFCENVYCNENYQIGKVKYSNKKAKITQAFLDYLFGENQDDYRFPLSNTELTNVIFRKSTMWKYEKEWRVVTYGDFNHKNHEVTNIQPCAVYLGSEMPQVQMLI